MRSGSDRVIPALVVAALLVGCDRGADADYLTRPLQDEVFYFVLPDRFANGSPANDHGAPAGPSHGGFDPTHKAYYHGGDLNGLRAKLDYLQQLGITAIWMTPILRNQAVQGPGANESAAYHGYWIIDFTEVDPHFGGNEELEALIDDAHARDIKVFFDIITNHTADVIRYRECHNADGTFRRGAAGQGGTAWEAGEGEGCAYRTRAETAAGNAYTPFLPLGLAGIKRPAWLNEIRWYNNQGDSQWEGESNLYGDFAGLDDLDTSKAEVVEGFIAIFSELITRFRPDGFRIDTVRHVELDFWREFTPAILAHARGIGIPNFTVFGEAYIQNARELSVYTRHGALPSVLDFALQEALRQVAADGASPDALAELLADDDFYHRAGADARDLMTFTGNHDMGRIGYFLNKGEASGKASAAERLARSALAHSFLFFARGVPVIYYGDEQGFTGDGWDQDARENMFPSKVAVYNDNVLLGTDATTAQDNFNPDHPLYQHLARLSAAYRAEPALRRGQQVVRQHASDGATLVLSRLNVSPSFPPGDPAAEPPPSSSPSFPRKRESSESGPPAGALDSRLRGNDDGGGADTLVLFNFSTEPANVRLPAWAPAYELLHSFSGEHPAQPEHRLSDGILSTTIPPLSATVLSGTGAIPAAPLPELTALTAHTEEHHGNRFLIVEYALKNVSTGNQQHPLSIATRLLNAPTADAQTMDLSPPWRAVFPYPVAEPPANIRVEITLDNLAAERMTFERAIPLQ